MLNKGRYITNAVEFLTDISERMSQHAHKTFATHRTLKVAESGWLEADHSRTGKSRVAAGH